MSVVGCDVLVVAPHPDDAEIACAGSILQLVAAGRRVVVADLTRGEKGSRGDATTRAREADAASKALGLTARENLGLPDTEVCDDAASARALIDLLRRLRPALLLAPHDRDFHPDHVAAHALCRRAFFLSGLRHVHPDLGAPHRPQRVLWYPGNDLVEASVVVDISAVAERKLDVIRCYASQTDGADNAHFVNRLGPLERVDLRDRFYGLRIGARAGEGFVADNAFGLRDASGLL